MKLLNRWMNNANETPNPEDGDGQTPPFDSSLQSDSTTGKPRPRPTFK